jgi:hypothetical protein
MVVNASNWTLANVPETTKPLLFLGITRVCRSSLNRMGRYENDEMVEAGRIDKKSNDPRPIAGYP